MSRTQRSQLTFEDRTFDADPSLLVWFEEVGGKIVLILTDATAPAAPVTLAGLRRAEQLRHGGPS